MESLQEALTLASARDIYEDIDSFAKLSIEDLEEWLDWLYSLSDEIDHMVDGVRQALEDERADNERLL